jgi:carbamoyltransferase
MHGDDIVAAIQDERLVRVKRQSVRARFARQSVQYCLDVAGISIKALDLIVCSRVRGVPNDDGDIYLNQFLNVGRNRVPVLDIPHHYAHAASAFGASGFEDAGVLVVDGSGTRVDLLPNNEQAVVINKGSASSEMLEWLSVYDAHDTVIAPVEKQVTPPQAYNKDGFTSFGSLGDMYGAVGLSLFGSFFDGPGKVMGLAPYGVPIGQVEEWLSIDDGGLISFHHEAFMAEKRRCSWPSDFQGCANLAASVQRATEYALLHTVQRTRRLSGRSRLCYAGGVALNSIANERIVREGGFDDVFIVPAAEDSGVSIGAAYHGLWQLTGRRSSRRLRRDALGRTYSTADVDRAIASCPGVTVCTKANGGPSEVARLIKKGEIVGWFDGGAELGPRALGHRSILCDPTRVDGKDHLNAHVKHREGFRPFAPVVMKEHVTDWFDVPPDLGDSPFMLRVWKFLSGKAEVVPAVAHVDGTARVQTVTRDTHPSLYAVLEAFHAETGVPMLLNTSFNVAGEPIVESPLDALRCFVQTGIDYCVFASRIVSKSVTSSSILDCRFRLAASSVTFNVPVVNGRMDSFLTSRPTKVLRRRVLAPFEVPDLFTVRARLAEAPGCGAIAFATVTDEWGDRNVLLDHEHLVLFDVIDGRRTGRELLSVLPTWTPELLTLTLRKLWAVSLIECASAECAVLRSSAVSTGTNSA